MRAPTRTKRPSSPFQLSSGSRHSSSLKNQPDGASQTSWFRPVPGIASLVAFVARPSPSIYWIEYRWLAVMCTSVTCHEMCHMTLAVTGLPCRLCPCAGVPATCLHVRKEKKGTRGISNNPGPSTIRWLHRVRVASSSPCRTMTNQWQPSSLWMEGCWLLGALTAKCICGDS
jgi:hypothetical protein